ncbi:hypothetical protein VCRA2113O415_380037 [Vibrio crassostreae]|nr:hypothetical protein VCRA2113O415_380037 [Vibrio crassostreae]
MIADFAQQEIIRNCNLRVPIHNGIVYPLRLAIENNKQTQIYEYWFNNRLSSRSFGVSFRLQHHASI